ncbi:DUF1622 domain-containing protein [Dermatobacter hominis]|uniref:DUF1622 domain-containing protein n=1 Tax=Dermatobacter hominis TaxID=2884263 RepID=UPI001D0F5E0F|nr:DUF1622 domain-containing protein [Dermatobacter hominis]UDY34387.1 DUF1622 domain-containing protein [Dermatobacter hominis]
MEFDEVVSDVVTVIEAVGVVVLVLGAVLAFASSGRALVHRSASTRGSAYDELRRSLARVILLGLEILILADIIRTIVVDQTVQSVLVLGVIVIVRIVLSWSLQVEIDGTWPWARWRAEQAGAPVED